MDHMSPNKRTDISGRFKYGVILEGDKPIGNETSFLHINHLENQ